MTSQEINFLAKTLSPFKRTLNMRQRIDSLALPNQNEKRCILIQLIRAKVTKLLVKREVIKKLVDCDLIIV